MNSPVTFSFGENWQAFLQNLREEQVAAARADILEWLGADGVVGRRVIDIGSGSGLHSLIFHGLGAARVLSIDVDPHSVGATRSLWETAGRPASWQLREGSILDPALVEELAEPGFDLVYAWGVLHHTGDLWTALDNAIRLVADDGLLWIALYVKGPRYPRDLALKQAYNRAGHVGKKLLYLRLMGSMALKLLLSGQLGELKKIAFPKRHHHLRGMSIHHDVIDWLGGLPYEVASAGEVVELTRRRGLVLEKITTGQQGGNHIYLFSAPAATAQLRS